MSTNDCNHVGWRVSIITVCLNSVETIRETIESVLSQDYRDIEYIVVDGGSNDGTMDIINEYSDSIARIISESDGGIYDAMNKGIQYATGNAVCTLNSGDVYFDETVIGKLVRHLIVSDVDAVYADLVYVDPNDTARIIRYYDSGHFHPEKLRYGWMPAHPTFLAKRSLFDKWGLYSLNYRIAADFEMMVRLFCRAHMTYAYLPDVVIKMRTGGISTGGIRNSWILNNEIVRACRENGLETSLPRVLMKIPQKLLEHIRRPKVNLGMISR